MSGKLLVRFEDLSEAADALDSASKRLQEDLTDLDHTVNRLAETWEGDAHDAFHNHYRQWKSASRDLHRALRELHETVHTAHGNYAAARAANLRMWGRR
jgi:WXG100 family type VII secretion target